MAPSPEPVLVSACLLGERCRYDARVRSCAEIRDLADDARVPVCPEVLGGLGTPRPAAELVGGDGADVLAGKARVVTESGEDVTAAYVAGAEQALAIAVASGCTRAVLKSRSPSCGCGGVARPDGSVPGVGVFAALLRQRGIAVETREFDQETGPFRKTGSFREGGDPCTPAS